ncbi:MAG TPA: FAD-binding and (Fe-S)-binding domain-containing protein [Puia sp.]|jgi:D-lactate dehydrogenase|nr:FAD-binding and (Fe-S)-binding domain-containing protein [Puia sp.]
MKKNKDDIGKALSAILPADRIKTRYIDLVTYGSDAGFYYLLPRAVVQPVSEGEIVALFEFSHRLRIPLVFRAGGTSLSGQSITAGILVEIGRHWNRINITDSGQTVEVGPGITGAMVNARLKAYGRKIGPDPSSIGSALMGGILSNNSSGMCCGVVNNSYHTTRAVRFILPNGKTFDTGVSGERERFEKECPEISGELNQLSAVLAADTSLRNRIRDKYRIKNTVGYSLNAFLDYSHPLDILAHLLIGGEGTLGFIAGAVLETIPQYPCRSTALVYFRDLYAACEAIPVLIETGGEAVELMDRASLRAVEDIPGMPPLIRELPAAAAALLVEYQDENDAALQAKIVAFMGHVPGLSLLHAPEFTTDVKEQDLLWKVRKGLFPSVGAVRKSGTTVILEDIAFPPGRLGDALTDLRALFDKHRYPDAIIFGHAKDGNIHFVITQSFHTDEDVRKYDVFIQEMVTLVVDRYGGALKAEHGTGRNMAPFVETEWGTDAYMIMRRLKRCIDPENLLNPGVIISDDERAHIRDIKQLPSVEQEVDKCIECGYCEHVCPSRDLTLTPRRRIVARRVLRLLEASGDRENHALLLEQYQYDGLDTCAVDGLCSAACPVDINTGDLVKRLRREDHSRWGNRMALWVAKHFRTTERVVGAGLRIGAGINRLFGAKTMTRLTKGMRRIVPGMPVWPVELGAVSSMPRGSGGSNGSVVYFPACVSRIMSVKGQSVMDAMVSVSRKAGIGVIIPDTVKGACCGQLFSSKGYGPAFGYTANRIVDYLWEVTRQGKIPVVTDLSSCAYTLMHIRGVLDTEGLQRYDKLVIMDSVDYLHDMVLPLAAEVRREEEVVLHPVCSLQKMKTYDKLVSVARHFSKAVTVPLQAGCCGMAGDRGFLFPELTDAATRGEATEVRQREYDGYYSSAVSCELALTQAVGKDYVSVLFLADRAMKDGDSDRPMR